MEISIWNSSTIFEFAFSQLPHVGETNLTIV